MPKKLIEEFRKKYGKVVSEMATTSGAIAAAPSIAPMVKKKKKKKTTEQDKIAETINNKPKFLTVDDVASFVLTDDDIIESYNDNYERPNQEERRTNMGMADGTAPAGSLDDNECEDCDTIDISDTPKPKNLDGKSAARSQEFKLI